MGSPTWQWPPYTAMAIRNQSGRVREMLNENDSDRAVLQVPFHSKGGGKPWLSLSSSTSLPRLSVSGTSSTCHRSRSGRRHSGEHTRDLDKHRNQAIEIIEMLQINVISRANHEDRLWKSLSQRLPGLLDLPSFGSRRSSDSRSVALRTLTSHTSLPGVVSLARG